MSTVQSEQKLAGDNKRNLFINKDLIQLMDWWMSSSYAEWNLI